MIEDTKNIRDLVKKDTIGICKECKKKKKIGQETKECLECLDWKMSDNRK